MSKVRGKVCVLRDAQRDAFRRAARSEGETVRRQNSSGSPKPLPKPEDTDDDATAND